MARQRSAPVSGTTICAIVVMCVVIMIAGALLLFAGTECSQTETGCRHNEIDFN